MSVAKVGWRINGVIPAFGIYQRALISIVVVSLAFVNASAAESRPVSNAKTTSQVANRAVIGSWTVENGLPGNAIAALAPASDGYLWLGGLNGLARFEGTRFVRFRLWDGLTSLQVQHLREDRHGRLWIGTADGGLIMREEEHFHPFGRTNGLGGDSIRALAEDAKGNIWVAHETGLARWDGNRFIDMALPPEKAGRAGCNFVFCGSNSVWALNEDWFVREWRGGEWKSLPRLAKPGFRFAQIFGARDGGLWGQLYPSGMAKFDGMQWQVFAEESGLPKSYISCVLDQGSEGLLCGSYDHGLFLFKDGHAIPAGLNEAPDMDGVLSLSEDELRNLWVGTKTRGLLRLREARVQIVAGSDRARVARVAFDTRGRLWLAGREEVWFERDGELVQVPPASVAPRLLVATLKPAATGGVWISSVGKGLWLFDPDRHQKPIQVIKPAKGESLAVFLTEYGTNGLWYATDRGKLGRLNAETPEPLAEVELPANKRFTGLLSDSAGGLWAWIQGVGFIRINAQGKIIERVGPGEGLPINSIRCWLSDGEGGLWFGTPAGLYWWRHGKLLSFDSRQGLPEDVIANLADDLSGHLWCTANNRLFRLTKKELEQVAVNPTTLLHPIVIGRSTGLTSVPFAAGIAARAVRGPQGRLFFPRIWDVVSFDPADFNQPEPPPRVLIEEVFVDGRKIDLPLATGKPLRVPAGTAEIAVRYAALCVAPETLQFRYRLDGDDETWSEAGAQRVVNFRRLPPGDYRFRVTASAAGGAWAEPGATIDWHLVPFFWQTATFRFATVIATVGLVAAFGWIRVRNLEQRRAAQELFARQLLESEEGERRRIAAELHDGLGQNLVLVKNLALMDQLGAGVPAKTPLHTAEIAAAADRALEEVHAISYALRPPELDRLGLAQALAGLVRRAGEASGIHFKTMIDLNGALAPGSDIQLFRIAQEATNNLVKHSGAKTARVELWRDEAGVHLIIADDGRGLDGAERKGLGLAGIEERVRLLGGQLHLASMAGNGTTLSVLVPSNGDS